MHMDHYDWVEFGFVLPYHNSIQPLNCSDRGQQSHVKISLSYKIYSRWPIIFANVYSGIINLTRCSLYLIISNIRAIYHTRGRFSSLNTRQWFYVFRSITVIGNWKHGINGIYILWETHKKSALWNYDVYWATANKLAVFWSRGRLAPMESENDSSAATYRTYLALPLLGSRMFHDTCCTTPIPSYRLTDCNICLSGTNRRDFNERVK